METVQKPLLLIVEDDPRWQTALQRALGSEYLIKTAFSRLEAENSLDVLLSLEAPPTVCVLDPSIPDVPAVPDENREETLQEAQRDYRVGEAFAHNLNHHEIPFVILTGRAGTARMERALQELGAAGYFRKQQWQKDAFLTKIRELVTQPKTAQDADNPNQTESEEMNTDAPSKNVPWQFLLAWLGSMIVTFSVLTVVARLAPENVVSAVIGGGLVLSILLTLTLILVARLITGEQYKDIVKSMLNLNK